MCGFTTTITTDNLSYGDFKYVSVYKDSNVHGQIAGVDLIIHSSSVLLKFYSSSQWAVTLVKQKDGIHLELNFSFCFFCLVIYHRLNPMSVLYPNPYISSKNIQCFNALCVCQHPSPVLSTSSYRPSSLLRSRSFLPGRLSVSQVFLFLLRHDLRHPTPSDAIRHVPELGYSLCDVDTRTKLSRYLHRGTALQ